MIYFRLFVKLWNGYVRIPSKLLMHVNRGLKRQDCSVLWKVTHKPASLKTHGVQLFMYSQSLMCLCDCEWCWQRACRSVQWRLIMYKEILNYLGCYFLFLHPSPSHTQAGLALKPLLWTPFTDNAKCTALKSNLKSCTNMSTLKWKEMKKKSFCLGWSACY